MYHNLTFARIWPQEPLFLRSDLGSSSIFITGVRHDLEILYHCGKRVKTKSQNFLGVNSFVCRSYREKLAGGLFVPTPILNRVIIDACVVAFCVFFLKKKLLLNLRILFFTGACNISICDSVLKLRILKASVTYEILIYSCVQILFWKIKKSNKGW